MKKIILLFLVLSLFTKSYANDLDFIDEWKTIRELKENIETLDKDKDNLDVKITSFEADLFIIDYLKENLTYSDFENLKIIISDYNEERFRLEKLLNSKSVQLKSTTSTKIKLLELKKDLYTKITPYIKEESYPDYLKFIKSDTSLYSEKQEIDSDILRKQEILNNKVEVLEKRIERHKEFIENNLRLLVEKKIEEKIFALNENENFLSLNKEEKNTVLEKTISKIRDRITDIDNFDYTDNEYLLSSNEKKIEIYEITLEKLLEFSELIK